MFDRLFHRWRREPKVALDPRSMERLHSELDRQLVRG
jgi:hypothetical protein